MIVSRWRIIARLTLDKLALRKDDPIGEVKRKIFDAYPFGERRYTPYKIWLEEVHRCYPWIRNPKNGEIPRPGDLPFGKVP